MPPAAATYAPRPRQARGRRLATTLLMGVLATGVISTPAATGAWFTADKTVSSNSLTAATLQPVSGLKAVKSSTGVDVSWTSALQQPWATANSITTEPTYTVTRTIDGANPTTISTGTARSASDAYPPVSRIANVTFDSGNGIAGYIRYDGTVYMWGASNKGALGRPFSGSSRPQLVEIPTGNPMISISMSNESVVAVSSNGTLWGWGTAPKAGCTGEWTNSPVQIPLPSGVKPVAASAVGSCAILVVDSSGRLWQRGGTANSGEFAKSGTSFRPVVLPGGRSVKQLTKAEKVLATDGTVWSWGGTNTYGDYGDGTQTAKDTPTQARIPDGVIIGSISTDDQSSVVALSGYYDLYVWGANTDGQLGTGNTTGYLTPFHLSAPVSSPIIDVKTGGRSTTILTRDLDIYTTGSNDSGRLGIGSLSPSQRSTFGNIGQAYNVSKIAMSSGVSGQTFLYKEGNPYEVQGWGRNSNGTPGVSFMGYDDDSTTNYTARVTMFSIHTPYESSAKVCSNGASPDGGNYCVPSGTIEYSVTYLYQSWTAASAKATAH
ncbi:hypothetical protein [Microbacterium sp. SORGH_AS_0421]|uniref:RCC1 domain-containing protein n=1 Tax=Microbacterium sp. SORGH_AS_0421 TaxID=3041768 RepID=UPI002793250E|nr:hypothetical protein [Microbacterium sp. SORGH_AS_0421]MDQ1176606.1 alpha-tubulin suppressor-like RCC1 family protein [Microbacterium sp. SORGH_AS_0421]